MSSIDVPESLSRDAEVISDTETPESTFFFTNTSFDIFGAFGVADFAFLNNYI